MSGDIDGWAYLVAIHVQDPVSIFYHFYMYLPNNGIKDCATVKEKTSLGPTTRIFGVNPLKNAPNPSCLIISFIIVTPPVFVSKFAFWIRVLTTSKGAETVIEATAPPILATKF